MTAKDLKNALLQEAVQGKLVPQIKSEGNARDLLEEIRKEKYHTDLQIPTEFAGNKNVKSGDLRSKSQIRVTKKELPEIPEDEIPFDIPESWCWCRLGDVFQHNTGKTQNSSVETKNGTLRKFITTSNLYWNEFDFTKVKEMLFSDSELERCTVTKGDFLVCEGGDYGRSAIWSYDYDVCFQNHIHRLRAFKKNSLCTEFYYYVIFLFKNTGLIQGKGVGIKSLSTETLHQLLIPLPPLAEQKRIVAAIEQFMPLIEEYGKKEAELTDLNAKISTLTKKAILQEAVQGKLVPQIKSEGNAMELLEEIRKERMSHGLDFANAKSGKKKGAKEAALADSNPCDIPEDEIPFDIPESWEWCRLGEVVKDFLVPQRDKPKDFNGNIPWCRIEDIEGMYLNGTHTNKYVSEDTIKSMNLKVNPIGTVISANSASIGAAAITTVECCTNQTFIGLVCSDALYNYYLYFFLKAIKDKLRKMGTGTTISYISQDKYKEMLIPLPPLAEQKRIVEAIERLLPLCEKLGG